MGSMKRKKPKKREKEWAVFQQEHGLTDETLQLKAPVKIWIRDLYKKLEQRRGRKLPSKPVAEHRQEASLDHDSIVRDWKANAQRRSEENYQFLRSLKFRDYGFKPDELMSELHARVFQIVDCTRCANCCKATTTQLNDEDISRIAAHLNLAREGFIEKYLKCDPFRSAYTMIQAPCPFLGENGHCTIYDIRPTVCRDYPHTDKPDRISRSMITANNTLVCPAVFWIVERMKEYAQQSAQQS